MLVTPASLSRPAPQITVFANARLVLPDEVVTGSLIVRDGGIAAIDQGRSVPAGALDCEGDLLAPALIELHTDNLERHLQPRPGVHWPHKPAIVAHDAELASVGIGTVFDALRVGSIVSRPRSRYGRYARPLASEILAMRDEGALRISHMLHLRAETCSETLLDELAEFGPEDRVGLLSLMDHTPGQRQFRDLDRLRRHLGGKYGMEPQAIEEHIVYLSTLRDRLGADHEAQVVSESRRLGAVLASHDDTTARHVAHSATLGVVLAEFPTTLEAARACRRHGVAVMMGAPNLLRGASHSGNVAAEDAAAEGLLDALSSDYAPASLLAGAMLLGERWGDLARGLAAVTAAPARAAGLVDRGVLAPDFRADLLRIRADGIASRVVGHWHAGQRIA